MLRPAPGPRRSWAVVAAFLATLLLPAAGRTEPLLWRVSDGDSTVYLFGTLHALKPGIGWESRTVTEALARSDSLWLETELASSRGPELVRDLGIARQRPLSDHLEPELLADVANLSRKLGLDFAQVDQMRPWLAAVTLTAAAMRQSGFTATGADVVLAREATLHAIEIAGLDDGDRPVEIFASLPPSSETALLAMAAADLDAQPPSFALLFQAWLDGNETGLQRYGTEDLRTADPALYERVIVARNRGWVAKVEDLLLGRGTHFVAIGCLHLVGPDNLRLLLADRGYRVEPVRSF